MREDENLFFFPKVIDTWITILAGLSHTTPASMKTTRQSGGKNIRLKELKKAGLIGGVVGCKGGFVLTRPLEEIMFSHLLAIFPHQPCPTLSLFHRYADTSVLEITRWPEIPKRRQVRSLDSIVHVLSQLSMTYPTDVQTLSSTLPYSVGTVEQILSSLVPLRLVMNYQRQGKILLKPFDTMTVGGVTSLLAHRGHVHAAIIARSSSVRLIDLLQESS